MKKNKLLIAIGTVVLIGIVSLLIYKAQNKSASDGVLRIGAILPLTGPVADDGQEAMRGVKIAGEMIKSKSEAPVDVLIEDGKYSPKESIAAFRKLSSQSNVGAMVAYGVVPVEVMMPIIKGSGMPLLATAVGAKDFPSRNDGFIRVWFPIGRISRLMSEYANTALNTPKIALFCIDNSYGLEAMDAFASAYKNQGGIVVAKETFSMDDMDVKSQLVKSLKSSPNVFFISGFGQGYISAINQLRELGFMGVILTDTAIVDPKVRKSVKNVSNIYFVDSCFSDICDSTPEAMEFKQKYMNMTSQQEPSMQALFSYEAIMLGHDMLKNGIEAVMCGRHNSILGEISFGDKGEIVLPLIIRRFTNEGNIELVNNKAWMSIR